MDVHKTILQKIKSYKEAQKSTKTFNLECNVCEFICDKKQDMDIHTSITHLKDKKFSENAI